MSSIRPLATITLLACVGVILYVKIDEKEPSLPPGMELPPGFDAAEGDWSAPPTFGEPLEIARELPGLILEANPAIAAIGGVSLVIMFLWPLAGRRVGLLKKIPSPLVVLLLSVAMGAGFDLLHEHSYVLQGHKYQLGEQYLVSMPRRVFGMFDEVTLPAFSALPPWPDPSRYDSDWVTAVEL